MAYSSLYVPKTRARPFSWAGDPRDELSKRGPNWQQNLTGADASKIIDYNRNLYQPIDRGGGFGAQPVSTPSAASTQPAQNAAIEGRYGNGTSGQVTYVPPSTGNPMIDRQYPDGTNGVVNPNYGSPGTPAVASSPAGGIVPQRTFPNTQDAGFHGALGPPDGTTGAAGPVGVPGQTAPFLGVGANQGGGFIGVGTADIGTAPTHPDLAGAQPIGEKTPEQKQADWIAKGGSAATWHQAQAAAGLRPAIDGRSTPAGPGNPNYVAPVKFNDSKSHWTAY